MQSTRRLLIHTLLTVTEKMIGILCKDSEKEAAREFFELFKTPWEFLVRGRQYDVVLSTLSEVPALHSCLFILYSSTPTYFDDQKGIALEPPVSSHLINQKGIDLPIYGRNAILNSQGQAILYDQSNRQAVAIKFLDTHAESLRVGYDLFHEVRVLLSEGQTNKNALIPTLELHISLLRDWILDAGIPLIEIPPIPWGYKFIGCLTHDVDFGGIRLHKLDHAMWGFVYRAFLGSFVGLLKGRCSITRLMKNWIAVLSLPLVYLGITKDFWDDFERYIKIEGDVGSTFFLIPFKNRVGDKVEGQFSLRRATRYDISDLRKQTESLINQGFEIGLHGIDAWNGVEKGRQERNRIVEMTGQKEMGVRIHWLFFDRYSPAILEQAGFDYDSTFGYNEAIGYKAGTTQVFRPLGIDRLLELPVHIQDTALFYSKRLALSPSQAWNLCRSILKTATRFGGVVTLLWHQRSLAPERLWDEFYFRLLRELKSLGVWFGTASQVVRWFRQRRSVTFEETRRIANTLQVRMKYVGNDSEPCMFLRLHKPRKAGPSQLQEEHSQIDFIYKGETFVEIPLA
jgi:hypothetical protein